MPSVPHILELPLKRNVRSSKTRCTIEVVVVVIILGFSALVAVYTFFFRDRGGHSIPQLCFWFEVFTVV